MNRNLEKTAYDSIFNKLTNIRNNYYLYNAMFRFKN